MTQHFKVVLAFRKRPYGQPIHFKMDGGRFDTERTVKLNVNTKYNVEVTLKPARQLTALNFQGESVTLQQKQTDQDGALFRTDWFTSGLDKCKKGIRQPLHVLFQIKDAGELKVTFQCKFYSETEKEHAHWGTVLNQIELDCQVPESASYVDVVKETFR